MGDNLPAWAEFGLPISIALLPLLLIAIALIRKRRRDLAPERAPATREPGTTATPSPATVAAPNAATIATPVAPATADASPTPAAPRGRLGFGTVLAVLFSGLVLYSTGKALLSVVTPDFRMLPPSMPKLAESLGEYVEIAGLKRNTASDIPAGKAVIVDKDKEGLHPLMRGLPGTMKATVPEDVDYVIWVDGERLPNPDFQLTLAAKPTPEEIARRTGGALSQGIPMDTVTLPTYKAKWTLTVVDLKKKEIKATKAFVGPNPPSGELDFSSPWLSGQQCVYVDDEMVKGCEVLFSDKGDILLAGKRLAGVVAPVPWDEALAWIEEILKP